jgi:AcrR family transcriptional regulator
MRDREITDRREAVLDAALQLFSERGFFNTSVHDIQRAANVSFGSIYHHFGNKEAIAEALFEHIETKMSDMVAAIVEHHTTAHDRCREVITYLFDLTEKEQSAMHYMLYARHQEFMPDGIPICSSKPFSMMKKVVEEGIEAGEVMPIDVSVAAAHIFGGALRLIHLRLDGVLEQPLSTYLDDCWACAWRGVGMKRIDNTTAMEVEA